MVTRKSKVGALLVAMLGLVTLGCSPQPGETEQSEAQSSQTSQSDTTTPVIDPIDEIWEGMTDSQKVASVLMLHVPGVDFSATKEFLDTYQPAGIILMGDNIPEDERSLRTAIDSWQEDQPLPFLIGIDEEGGVVSRLESDDYPGADQLRDGSPDVVRDAFSARAALLESLGININFGVIADYTDNEDSFIYRRVLGTNATSASANVAAAVEAERGKVLSTLKHFPGHGVTDEDSHVTVPTSSLDEAQWNDSVRLPFSAGIEAGTDAVMVGHLLFPTIDPNPASMSPTWYAKLRNEDFSGIAITDDMAMLRATGDPEYADAVRNAVAAINAGATLVLDVGDEALTASEFASEMINGLTASLEANVLSRDALDAAGHMVLQARYDLAQDGDE